MYPYIIKYFLCNKQLDDALNQLTAGGLEYELDKESTHASFKVFKLCFKTQEDLTLAKLILVKEEEYTGNNRPTIQQPYIIQRG